MNCLWKQAFLLVLVVALFIACSADVNEPDYRCFAYVADYGAFMDGITAKVFAFEVDEGSGGLTSVTGSPFSAGPALSVGATPSGKFIVMTVGWPGYYVEVKAVDPATGALAAVDSRFLDFPDLVAMDPLGRFVYVQAWNTRIHAFRIDPTSGALADVAGSPYVVEAVRSMVVDPSGRRLYVSNYDSGYSIFTIDPSTGGLSAMAGSPFDLGRRGELVIAPSGRFVYMTDYSSTAVSIFAADTSTGVLTEVAGSPFLDGDGSGGIVVAPSGKFAYIVNRAAKDISAYTINSATGLLTEVPGSPYPTGDHPGSFALAPSGEFAYLANEIDPTVISTYTINPATGALTKVDDFPIAGGYALRHIILIRIAQQGLS